MQTGNKITPSTWYAHGQGTYQLPVEESLAFGPLTKKPLAQCVKDMT